MLRTYLVRYRGALIAVVVLQFMQTLCTLILPGLNADIIDKGIATGDTGYIWRVGAIMLGVTLIQIMFAIGAVYYGSRTAMAFGRDVRSDLFHQVTGFSAQEVGTFGAPTLITRITNDVQQVQMLVLLSCTLLVAAPIAAVGGTVLAIREDAGLSWLLLISIPALVISVGMIVYRMVPQFRVMQERIDGINQVLREQITGMRVVRAFVRERHEARRFGQVNAELTETALRAGRLMALMFPTVGLVLNTSTVAVLWLGADRVADGSLSVGAMIAFISYLTQILMAVMMATFMAILVPRAAVSSDRIQEVLDTESSVVLAADPVMEVPLRGSVELRNVSFQYPGAESPVLSDISLVLERRDDDGDHRQHGVGQDDAARTAAPAVRRHRRRRSWWTGSTSASSTTACCAAASGWCPSGRTCSRARWPATCATASPTPPTTSCGRR